MTRYLLVGAAAFAMMTGVAFAQDAPVRSSTTTEATTTTVPAAGDHYRTGDTTYKRVTHHVSARHVMHHVIRFDHPETESRSTTTTTDR